MAIHAPKVEGGGDFKIAPEGTHPAVCDMVVNLGEQRTEYNGEVKFRFQIYVRFQLPGQRIEIDGADLPQVIGQVYTLSLYERAKLRQHLESWRGKSFTEDETDDFDVATILGKPALISVTHRQSASGREYANITGIMGMPEGSKEVPVEGELRLYEGSEAIPDWMPNWLKEKLEARHTEGTTVATDPAAPQGYHEPVTLAGGQTVEFDDDIPF